MAYVRKTETLVREVLQKVEVMSSTAQKPYLTETITENSAEYKALSSAVETVSWKLAPELKDKMPSEWSERLARSKRVEVIVEPPVDCPESGRLRVNIESNDAPFCLSPEHFDPNTGSYYNNPKITFVESDIPPIVMAWFKGGKSNEATRAGLKTKFDKVRKQLELFMHQHSSLNTAIKAMPEIEHYVPDEYIQKLHAPSPPRGKAATPAPKEELDIDVDALTSAAVAHQIASAS
jgi:hypothetical protein